MNSPEDLTVFNQVKNLLSSEGVNFTVAEHEPFNNSEEAAEFANVDPSQAMKSIVLRSMGKYALAILPASERIDSQKIRELMGVKRVSFATPEEVLSVMGCSVGVCHPFGILCNVDSFVDTNMSLRQTVYFNAGSNRHTFSMSYADYEAVSKPMVGDFTKKG